ncbi:hypothetical protein PESP_a2001 [Pseudoalteromonas espejiana DSM 9414]|nr:hypothetical protein PESP_a2001 [Pseudoalteromonas espejiana DSM 9414]
MQVCFCVFYKNKSLFLKSTLIAVAYNLIKRMVLNWERVLMLSKD